MSRRLESQVRLSAMLVGRSQRVMVVRISSAEGDGAIAVGIVDNRLNVAD